MVLFLEEFPLPFVRFPEDIIEKEIWASHLGIKDVKSVKNHDRVSVIHFFEVDSFTSFEVAAGLGGAVRLDEPVLLI